MLRLIAGLVAIGVFAAVLLLGAGIGAGAGFLLALLPLAFTGFAAAGALAPLARSPMLSLQPFPLTAGLNMKCEPVCNVSSRSACGPIWYPLRD